MAVSALHLVFEDSLSVDMTLQWATYKDASDQTSSSRRFSPGWAAGAAETPRMS